MKEQSKSAKRRYNNGNFHTKYFVGNGIDVGCGNDSMFSYINDFAKLKWVSNWDIDDGDAQYLASIGNCQYDFLHSSHCLEHMFDPYIALSNWIRVVKPGGYLIITVPDEKLYEHNLWPSNFNSDHKFSFSIHKNNSPCPNHVNILDLAIKFSNEIELEKVELITDFINQSNINSYSDLTLQENPECSIEIIWKKY